MSLETLFKAAATELDKRQISYAVAGRFVARCPSGAASKASAREVRQMIRPDA